MRGGTPTEKHEPHQSWVLAPLTPEEPVLVLEVDDVATCTKHLKREGNEPTNRTVILWDMNRFGIDVEVIEKVARVGPDSTRPITRGRHKRDRQVVRVGSGSSSAVGETEEFSGHSIMST